MGELVYTVIKLIFNQMSFFFSYYLDKFLKSSYKIGDGVMFCIRVLVSLFSREFYFSQFLKQFVEYFFYSLPIIGLTAIFTGAVLALQSYTGFSRINAESAVSSLVVLSITRELGPVLSALMFSGRVGARITAEIATMKVSEQIDAIMTFRIDPIKYIVVPRFLACFFAMPLLVIVADIIGVYGGYIVGVNELKFDSEIYIMRTVKFFKMNDFISGFIKSFFFGTIISIVSCYFGYNSTRSSTGVGKATTDSVVFSAILILLVNYSLTSVMFST